MEIVKRRPGLFLIANCCVLMLLMAACLPRSAHAEEELYWSISWEYERVTVEGKNRWLDGRKISYGAAWNYKTPEEAAIAAHKECQKKARNPLNCMPPGDTAGHIRGIRMTKDECWVIVKQNWNRGGYDSYGIYNNERAKADARSGRDQIRYDTTFELMICDER